MGRNPVGRGWVFLAFWLGLALGAQALDPAKRLTEYRMERWDSTRGFPAQAATEIIQSRSGHLWVATFNGLARFDGTSFRVFHPANTPAMTSGNLWSLCEDSTGTLWFSTTGRELFQIKEGKVTQIPLEGGPGNVLKLALDASGTLWIGSNQGLFRFEKGRVLPAPGDRLGRVDITALHMDRERKLWIATRRQGLWVLDQGQILGPFHVPPPGKTPEILSLVRAGNGDLLVGTLGQGVLKLQGEQLVPPSWGPKLGDSSVGAMLLGSKGELWVGGNQGLHRVIGEEIQHLGEREGFPEERIQSLFQDREGNLWVGPWRDGLIRLSNGKFRVYSKSGGLPHNTVLSMDEDAQGRIWVGTHQGVARIDPGGIDPLETINRQLPKARDIKELTFDRQGLMWISTTEAVFRIQGQVVLALEKAPGEPLTGIRVMVEAQAGGLWLGGSSGLSRYRNGHLEPVPTREALGQELFVLSLYEDPQQRLWLGSRGHGLVLWDQGRFTSYRVKDGLPSDSVFRVTPDEDGSLWIGTANGVARFHEGRFQALGQRQGLLSGAIYQILPAGNDHLWLLGERGFCRLSRAEVLAAMAGRIPQVEGKAFDEGDGLRVAACTSVGKGLRARDGRIGIPTTGGLVVAEPGPLPSNPVVPPVSVDLLLRDGRETLFPAGIQTLPPGTQDVEIHFSAPSLVAPERVRFRYVLEGSDPQWRESGGRRFAVYSRLNPGRYRFRVIACNNDGVWNLEGTALSILIQPRFHQTWLFRCLLLVAASALGLGIHRYRLRALKAQARELEGLVEARTHELAEANEALRNQSLTDPLTGLRNRRYLGVCMPEDIAQVNRAQRQAESASEDRFALNIDLLFIMVDVDHFKEVNDTHGHHAGDLVLQQLADILREATRDTDTLIRWGGEEFLVVGRNACRREADILVERIRAEVAAHPFDIGTDEPLFRTCSLGFTFFPFLPTGPDFLTWEAVVDLADHCLYVAKRSGRNAWVGLSPTIEATWGSLGSAPAYRIEALVREGTVDVLTSLPPERPLDWQGRA